MDGCVVDMLLQGVDQIIRGYVGIMQSRGRVNWEEERKGKERRYKREWIPRGFGLGAPIAKWIVGLKSASFKGTYLILGRYIRFGRAIDWKQGTAQHSTGHGANRGKWRVRTQNLELRCQRIDKQNQGCRGR